MDARRLVAERGLVAAAVSALTAHAFVDLPFESLGPTKTLLKRFFSAQSWLEADDEALAAAVGGGEGWWRQQLDDELVLEFGWIDGRFVLRVEGDGTSTASGPGSGPAGPRALEVTFDGPIVPEATPNPRTLAFRTGPIHEGESRSYASAAEVDDPRVARLFRSFPDLATVLVARDFVALTLRRPDTWETLLAPVLKAVTEEFASGHVETTFPSPGPSVVAAAVAGDRRARGGKETRLDRAWRELGSGRGSDPAHVHRLIDAASGPDAARRQVAASLLGEAPPETALAVWARLLGDPSRTVRRSVVDAMVDAGREELRPLLERALSDTDPWVRWKGLRGLAELGVAKSRAAVQRLVTDQDFRVRLEALAALRE